MERDTQGARLVLGDLRVLELGDSFAAAVCGRLFAELGAEVLQVRLPEEARATGVPESTEARDARVVVDALKCRVDKRDLAALAAQADLIILGGSPGTLEARGW